MFQFGQSKIDGIRHVALIGALFVYTMKQIEITNQRRK